MNVCLACLLAIAAITAPAAQDGPPPVDVWKVSWREVSDSTGATTRVPVFMFDQRPPAGGFRRAPEEIAAVVRVDERLRIARAGKDATQIVRLVSAGFYGTDPDGTRITRQQWVDAISGSTISAVDTRASEFRLASGAVIVSGQQDITAADGAHRTAFTRVYSRDPQDQEWHLISSTEMPVR
jgi:hypothetical protein